MSSAAFELIETLLLHCQTAEQFNQHLETAFGAESEALSALSEYTYQRVKPSTLTASLNAVDTARQLKAYMFTKEYDFLRGLAEILTPTLSLADFEERVAKAKAFYYAKRFAIPYSRAYKEWALQILGFDPSLSQYAHVCPFAKQALREQTDAKIPSMFEVFSAHDKVMTICTTDHPQYSAEAVHKADHLVLVIKSGIMTEMLSNVVPSILIIEGEADSSLFAYLFALKGGPHCYCTDGARVTDVRNEERMLILRAADLLHIGACQGMVPVGTASRILATTPFLFHAFGADVAIDILQRLFGENIEYAGPSQLDTTPR